MTEEVKDDWDEFLEAAGTAPEEAHTCQAIRDDLNDYCNKPATVAGRDLAHLFKRLLPDDLMRYLKDAWYCEDCANNMKQGLNKQLKSRYTDE